VEETRVVTEARSSCVVDMSGGLKCQTYVSASPFRFAKLTPSTAAGVD
jgi:hypothetical protein